MVPILKSQTLYYQVISRSPFFCNDVLSLPSNLAETVFKILHEFICRGDYAPTLTQSLQGIEVRSIGFSNMESLFRVPGPPCILSPVTRAPPFLFYSVLAYNLAKHLGFEPMASAALNRLHALPFSIEDPNVVLEHIYMENPPLSPHSDIRAWVRKWLGHRLFTTLGRYADIYKTNLGVLEQHPQLTDRFHKLQYEAKYLAEDTRWVRAYFPVSRGPQTLQTSLTPGLIDWPNNNQTPTVQPTSSGIYGGPHNPAIANNPTWQLPDVPWFPPVEPSWTSSSSAGDPSLDEQRLREQFQRLNI